VNAVAVKLSLEFDASKQINKNLWHTKPKTECSIGKKALSPK
jgi:hypothetical protein